VTSNQSIRIFTLAASLISALMLTPAGAQEKYRNPSSQETVLWLPEKQPDARIRYASDNAVQFGDLRLPDGEAPESGFPVAIFIHGGQWTADWTKDYSNSFVEDLTAAGIATWDIEFRRMGNQGGGYPGTFLDVAIGADHLRELAEKYPLDLKRVVAVGHSSGGHLALWLAARKNLPETSELYVPNPLPLSGVVSLAGVNDLKRSLELGGRDDVLKLVGVATRQEADPRFAETDPARLLPLGVPQALIVGTSDNEWRVAMTREYADAARDAGDSVELTILDGANHFDVVDPEGPAFPVIKEAVLSLAKGRSADGSK